MTLDGLTLRGIAEELQSLVGAKIEKIHQPEREELLLLLHTQSGKKRLLLSAAGGDSRLHLTEHPKSNPLQAPNFCMLLRKYIGGGRILSIAQPGLERIVRIAIEAKDEMGVLQQFTLVIEIMGKYSNIMLLNGSDVILDSIRHVSFDMSRVRQVLPGMAYVPPEMEKLNPLSASAKSIADVLGRGELPDCLPRSIEGISFQTAQEILARRYHGAAPSLLSEAQAEKLAEFLLDFIRSSLSHPSPCLQKNAEGMPVFFSIVPYDATFSKKGRLSFPTVNSLVDGYFHLRSTAARMQARRGALQKVLRQHIVRVEKKLKIQRETLAAGARSDTFRLYGELITANIYQIPRGAKEVTLTNYYTGEPLRVPLDVALSPSANAAKYFKKVGKLKNGALIAAQKEKEYAAELAYLEELEYNAAAAQTIEDLQEVRGELIKYGYLSAEPREKIKRSDPLASPLKFKTSDGFTVLAGRNSRQNDALTLRIAGGDDIWLHSKNLPGSHVILFTGGNPPTDTALLEAAAIAATLCRGKNAGKVDIDYCPRSHVWKANGARPGMVLYEGYHTLTVAPDAALLERLREDHG